MASYSSEPPVAKYLAASSFSRFSSCVLRSPATGDCFAIDRRSQKKVGVVTQFLAVRQARGFHLVLEPRRHGVAIEPGFDQAAIGIDVRKILRECLSRMSAGRGVEALGGVLLLRD